MDVTATPAQIRLLQVRFAELGYTGGRAGRAERLAVAAAALGVDDLTSFAELDRFQAGRLFGCLRHHSIPVAGTGLVLHEGWCGPDDDAARTDPEPVRAAAGPDLLGRAVLLIAVAVLVLREVRRQQRQDHAGTSAAASPA